LRSEQMSSSLGWEGLYRHCCKQREMYQSFLPRLLDENDGEASR
jgi:hypothetical protein